MTDIIFYCPMGIIFYCP